VAARVSVLRVDALQVHRGNRLVVRDVSFEADRGDLVAIMGESGTGKTTVLRAIAGLEPISGGTIEIDAVTLRPGVPLRGELVRDLNRRVGMVFQFHHLFANMSALDNVTLAPVHVLGKTPDDAEARARAMLDSLGVGHRASAMPHELSGGEAQRVAIARALAVEPPVLLMDEPTASLDPARRGDLAGTLRELAAAGRTIIVATHDAEFVRACARLIVRIENGAGRVSGPSA
jgi:ABC-type polar amino acid transport system ATPase subunit